MLSFCLIHDLKYKSYTNIEFLLFNYYFILYLQIRIIGVLPIGYLDSSSINILTETFIQIYIYI